MKSTRASIATAVALVAAFGGLAAPVYGAPAGNGGNAVTEWNEIAATTLTLVSSTLPSLTLAAGGAPPASQINMGMTQGAVYDAVNAIGPRQYQPYLLKRRFSANASKEAAVATAAYRVLYNIVSTVPTRIPFPSKASLLQSLTTKYAASLALISDSRSKAQGIAAGSQRPMR